MSRIGLNPITIPSGVTLTISDKTVMVKGPLGELKHQLPATIKVKLDSNLLTVSRSNDSKTAKALHGLTRSLLANMVTGTSSGFQKRLELIGTGYRVAKNGSQLTLQLGFSHPVEVNPPAGVTLDVEGQNKIIIKGSDKQAVGQIAAVIRAYKKPEPYKGKGIRYEGEVIRRKQGKKAV